ncbi:hypothetical protein PQX77_007844 [Marasmius sp. AFHP31]|nr:hypothetical protein PQX77_007844 [Marasmius sp. AFHP31]
MPTTPLFLPQDYSSIALLPYGDFAKATTVKSVSGYHLIVGKGPPKDLSQSSLDADRAGEEQELPQDYHLLRKSATSVEIATITPITKDPAAIWPAHPLPDPPVVRLETLRRLMYLNDHDDTRGPKCGTIFRSLEVPNLQTLILYDPAGRSSYHEAFEMLLRSGCKTLKRLDMRGAYLNAMSDIVGLLDLTGDTLESLYVDGVLNTVFAQYRRQRGTGTTAAIVADLAARMERGLRRLKKLNLRLKVSNVEYLGILGFEKLFRAVLKRNEMITLVLRVSGSSLCVKQLTRELEGLSSGGQTGGKVIIEAV